MIRAIVKGDFKKTKKFLKKNREMNYGSMLEYYAEKGVEALSEATPVRTGLTAASWTYEVEKERNKISIFWKNTNIQNGVPIAVILEYGHGTGWGSYVQGRHYISPAIQPIFDEIADAVRKEVSKD